MSKTLPNKTIFYGPHECDICGKTICKTAIEQGGEAYDYPSGIIYPNTEWKKHSCGDLKDVIKELRKKVKALEEKDPWIKIIEKEIWPLHPYEKFPSQPIYPRWTMGNDPNIVLCAGATCLNESNLG